ncbi:hypothetical protein EKE94_10910 [Mesobaculum littorinae]|uniref:Uncharacterized protein n=1 Tax=Mesobaculum littorinae TaxID=2486419 RepID=A0A438AGY0_9RHOB|nr:hypothetical protein [Mesobaculum littorinae]RVV97970.1 hypothetical protein EKE94_10910 [Mesobaculum littorinae]
MRRTLLSLAALAALGAALPASAAEIGVRTADHPGFTRIVVDFSDRPEGWRLGRAGDGYELRTQDPATSFDLSDVWRRIDGDRLSSLANARPGVLRFTVDCACTLTTIELPNQWLVIDVNDGAAPAGHPYEQALAPVDPAVATASVPDGAMPVGPVQGPANLPVVLDEPTPPLLPGALDRAANDPGAAVRHRRADETREALARQLARAAAQGLVDVVPPVPSEPPVAQAPDVAVATEQAPVPDLPLEDRPNVRIETQMDIDLAGQLGDRPGGAPASCPRDDRLDPTTWAEGDLEHGWVGSARAGLIDARDAPDAEGHLTLARQYLWLTFGAEALSLLETMPHDRVRDELAGIARLMDGRPAGSGPLAGLHNCDGPAALWGVLADPGPATPRRTAGDAVIAAFSALPAHLRRHLGPPLAQKFIAGGDLDTALAIRNAIDRLPALETEPQVEMLKATIDIEQGEEAAAETRLEQVSQSRSDEAATALATLIQRRIDTDTTVGPALVANAEALAYELKGAPEGEALQEVAIRALISDRDYAPARDRLAPGGQVDDPGMREALIDAYFERLATHAADAEFLPHAVASAALHPTAAPGRLPVADRLLALGLTGPARAILGSPDIIPSVEERLILARIAVIDDRPRIALGYLAGLDTARATEIRTEADAQLTRQEAATAEAAPPPPDPAAPPPVPGTLAGNRALLDDSRSIRDGLAALLSAGDAEE